LGQSIRTSSQQRKGDQKSASLKPLRRKRIQKRKSKPGLCFHKEVNQANSSENQIIIAKHWISVDLVDSAGEVAAGIVTA
jgi:hypothetical protein